eukprot:CAMPEP_0115864400 /NCGR_PEP_ID=MMETSP0287-20121206/19183_1 /TAXON_ID=412157 /ORGANISM="Chrysochromulina rotalis, Strain UIO044" /LENGTH=412 /DNA_ID=CAMNT_0003318873 /DNA_START=30 /DNA_END=1268 /DNA_ORIENTATION=+
MPVPPRKLTVLLCGLLGATSALQESHVISRRTLASVASATLLSTQPFHATAATSKHVPAKEVDWAAKTSFFGLVEPPIQNMWEYETLVNQARAGNIATVQIAVQHDVVMAKTAAGHRYACMLPDNRLPDLLVDTMGTDGSLPFKMLPIDETRAKIRSAAFGWLNLLGMLWVLDLNHMLPWDTTPYGSVAEREEAARSGERKASVQPFEPLHALLRKRKPSKSRQGARVRGDDAELQRVLGLATWDAAAELKDKVEREMIKARPHKLEDKLRPRQLEQYLIHAASELSIRVDELESRMRDAAWVTPSSLESTANLPTLNELLTTSWPVSSDGLVTQYIRAHPVTVSEESTAQAAKFPKPELMSGPWPTGDQSGQADRGWIEYETIEHDFCRLCPDFSAFYDHDVYICKKLAVA